MMQPILFDNSYARLPDRFYARLDPQPVASPRLIRVNGPLAEAMGLDPAWLASPEGVAMLAGNALPEGAEPLAQAYAGHQFGGFVPQLGDGRAILLGEVVGGDGIRRDVQLKGSGRTPFSRMGDGRAWLGPVLREYVVSEAMAATGVPTTRALAAVTTGETVMREAPLPGAVLTRVARSHVRVGTFQYFAVRRDADALHVLTDHVIARHYPDATGPMDLLRAVAAAQARLIAAWMGVGFVHGVMNTDNMSVAGETIDYGPCAFMEAYDPGQVFSSIDQWGRYAYDRQPGIAAWNLAQLGTCLLQIMPDAKAAVAEAQAVVDGFGDLFDAAWTDVFRAKIGLARPEPDDRHMIVDLLAAMADAGADFTNTFRHLGRAEARAAFVDPAAYDGWTARWRERMAREADGGAAAPARMAAANPAVIPRNHQVEAAIAAALSGDLEPFHALTDATARPFDAAQEGTALTRPATEAERVSRTFCGT